MEINIFTKILKSMTAVSEKYTEEIASEEDQPILGLGEAITASDIALQDLL
jgi:hypothetical protein